MKLKPVESEIGRAQLISYSWIGLWIWKVQSGIARGSSPWRGWFCMLHVWAHLTSMMPQSAACQQGRLQQIRHCPSMNCYLVPVRHLSCLLDELMHHYFSYRRSYQTSWSAAECLIAPVQAVGLRSQIPLVLNRITTCSGLYATGPGGCLCMWRASQEVAPRHEKLDSLRLEMA